MAILLTTSIGFNTGADATTKDDALNTVVNFLSAQKDCDVDSMVKYSEHAQKITNLKEFYSNFCKENPLQKATITKLSIINDTTAIASIESNYKDRIFISTMPVIKKDGNWKIIRGMPGTDYVEKSDNAKRTIEEKEIEGAIKDYSADIKSGEINKMKSHLIISPETNKKLLDNHLEALSEEPTPELNTQEINIIDDSVAIVHLQTKFDSVSFANKIMVCKENGQWKIVIGHSLMNASIPITEKPIEIK
ncbi:nuclear transport factor 2 family protein [Metabacillus litoralis]|nr:nuclear transport factor 2 family protein [Metabacillus litoralis]